MNDFIYNTEKITFTDIERRSKSPHIRCTIDGSVTGSSKCVGYCQYSYHPGFLTEKQRQQHNCIGNRCHYYLEKQKAVCSVMPQPVNDAIPKIIIQVADISEAVRVLHVKQTGENRYIASYISITNEVSFQKSKDVLKQEYGITVDFTRLDYDFDICVSLLCAS